MEIQIIVSNEDGEELYQQTTSSFETAQMILGSAERYVNELQVKAEARADAVLEEEANEKANEL